MKIALDLDGVVTNIGEKILKSCRDYNIDVNSLDVYNALTNPNGFEKLERVFLDKEFWNGLEPDEISWHSVNDLFVKNNDVIFITARRSDISVNAIEPWLDRWRIMYSTFIVCDMESKYEHINKIEPIVYVDDNPNEIKIILENSSVPSYVMKTWYNEHAIGDLPFIESLSELRI